MNKQILTVCVMSCFLIALANRPHAATRLTDDFGDLAKRAEEIVEAEVLSRTVVERNQTPWTVATLQIDRSYKGRVAENTSIAVEYPGGFDGAGNVVAPGQPRLNTGSKVLVLLVRRGSEWRVLSGDYGQVNLVQGSAGEIHAQRATGVFNYYLPDQGSLSGYQAVTQAEIPMAKLREVLSAIVKTGRPVIEATSAAPLEQTPVARQPAIAYSASSSLFSVLLASLTLIAYALRRSVHARV